MFYYKLLLIVIAGSIGIWFALRGFVASTDHLPGTFTVDSVAVEQRRQLEAAKGNHVPKHSTRENITPETDSETLTVQAPPSLNGSEDAAVARPFSVIDEKPAVVDIANALTEIAEIEGVKQQANQQDRESELSVAKRADSDADMQVDNANDSDTISSQASSQAENIQGKTLELDSKLLDTNYPNDATKIIKPDTVRALDIAYVEPPGSNCDKAGDDEYPHVGVHYRPGSYAIKGKSLTNIDMLIQVYDKCGGKLLVIDKKVDKEESDESLIQLRQDEVKYYLLQRRVPKADIIFSDN